MQRRKALAVLSAAALSGSWTGAAQAVENAAGFYLLGGKTAMAGFVPPPGTYLTDINYYYSGGASGSAAKGIALRDLGSVEIQFDISVDANAYINAPVALWIAPGQVLGGNVGFGLMVPVGWKDLDVGIDTLTTLTLPNRTIVGPGSHFEFSDNTTDFGDPVLNALIGWHQGNWHWTVGALLNVPIGPWEKSSSTNIAFNRWGLDTTAGVTWLDPAIGFEVSTAAGFTFNWENPDTDYDSGTEFHLEAALMQHFSKTFSLGIAGYHYQQVTGDSGAGARLGDFEGRVSALGPIMNYTLMCGKLPISTQLQWMHEFDAENRAEGDMGMFNVTIPLAVSGQ